MNLDLSQPASAPTLDERHCWLPPRRMWRCQWAKLTGGTLMVVIFAGWMLLQWESLFSRLLAGVLLVATVWIVAGSILADVIRSRGRQLAIEAGHLWLLRPGANASVPLAQIAFAQWRHDTLEHAGLWLFDYQSRPLLHIDLAFLADEAEAREFIGWARRICGLPLETRWPSPSL